MKVDVNQALYEKYKKLVSFNARNERRKREAKEATERAIKENKKRCPVYAYVEKEKETINPIHTTNYQYQKITRDFIFQLKKNFSNEGGIGLYALAALICNAVSCNQYCYKRNVYSGKSWIRGTHKDFCELLGYDVPDVEFNLELSLENDRCNFYRILETLLCRNYISFTCKKMASDEKYYIHINNQDAVSEYPSDKFRKAEYAAIKTHQGFVYLKKDYIDNVCCDPTVYKSKFSDCDAVLDLWMNTVYKDKKFDLSADCPMVLFTNKRRLGKFVNCLEGEYNGCITFRYLANRWNMSVGKVHKLLNKLEKLGWFTYTPVANHGIYIFAPFYVKSLYNIECKKPSLYKVFTAVYKNRVGAYYANEMHKRVKAYIKRIKNTKNKKQDTITEIGKKPLFYTQNNTELGKNLRSRLQFTFGKKKLLQSLYFRGYLRLLFFG